MYHLVGDDDAGSRACMGAGNRWTICIFYSILLWNETALKKSFKNCTAKIWKDYFEAEAQILWPADVKSQLTGKDPDAGKDQGQEEKGVTEDEMIG